MTLRQFMPVQKDEVEKGLESFEFAIEQTLEGALEFNICSQWAAEEAINLISKVKGYAKQIEEMRKRVNEPYRKIITYNNDRVKPFTDKLESIEKILKNKIEAWKKKKEEENKKLEEEAKLMQAALQLQVNPFVSENHEKIRTQDALAYEKSEWKYEVEDISQVPLSYLKIDEDKVKGVLKAGIREIPGLKIYEEKKTIIRSR